MKTPLITLSTLPTESNEYDWTLYTNTETYVSTNDYTYQFVKIL
jgi:hypothetical protein